jgi:hypothetical protein
LEGLAIGAILRLRGRARAMRARIAHGRIGTTFSLVFRRGGS